MQEGEDLKKIRSRLEKENKLLKESKEIDDQLIQQKVMQTRRQKKLLKEVKRFEVILNKVVIYNKVFLNF